MIAYNYMQKNNKNAKKEFGKKMLVTHYSPLAHTNSPTHCKNSTAVFNFFSQFMFWEELHLLIDLSWSEKYLCPCNQSERE